MLLIRIHLEKETINLKSSGQKLVFDLQKVTLAHVHFEWFVDNGETSVSLNILPPTNKT